MGVSALRGLDEANVNVEDFNEKTEEEKKEIIDKLTIPTDKILEQMMDKFLGFSKKARKTVI